MHETPDEVRRLQQLLDDSAATAGLHLKGIITDERRLGAEELCRRLQGMHLLTVATVTADSRPLAGPVDGYLLHGSFWFSSARNSVRRRHLASRPAVSATYLPSEELAVTVHGRPSCSSCPTLPAGCCDRPCSITTYLSRVRLSRSGSISRMHWAPA